MLLQPSPAHLQDGADREITEANSCHSDRAGGGGGLHYSMQQHKVLLLFQPLPPSCKGH